jgi:hypothetical protein
MMSELSERQRAERLGWYLWGGLLLLAASILLYRYLSRPPQMGVSEEAFSTVDALYTAVRSHDEKRLGQCEQRLHSYRDSGQLPKKASAALDAIIATARSGSWQQAAEKLYDFMLAQRREKIS